MSDEQWERVSPLLPGKIGDPGRSGADNRQFLEAIGRHDARMDAEA